VLVAGSLVLRLVRHPWFVLYVNKVDLWTDWLTRSFRQPIPHRLLAAARSDPAAWREVSPLLADQLLGYHRALEGARHDWRLGRYREGVLASLEAHIADLNRMQREIEGGRPVKSA
jgi:hypothetical protein